MKFKVGDLVKVIRFGSEVNGIFVDSLNNWGFIGKIGKVAEILIKANPIKYKIRFKDAIDFIGEEKCFELIKNNNWNEEVL